jgi:hypothetical protein
MGCAVSVIETPAAFSPSGVIGHEERVAVIGGLHRHQQRASDTKHGNGGQQRTRRLDPRCRVPAVPMAGTVKQETPVPAAGWASPSLRILAHP